MTLIYTNSQAKMFTALAAISRGGMFMYSIEALLDCSLVQSIPNREQSTRLFLQPSELRPSHHLTRRQVYPPFGSWGDTLTRGKGAGGSQFGRGDRHCGTLNTNMYLVVYPHQHTSPEFTVIPITLFPPPSHRRSADYSYPHTDNSMGTMLQLEGTGAGVQLPAQALPLFLGCENFELITEMLQRKSFKLYRSLWIQSLLF